MRNLPSANSQNQNQNQSPPLLPFTNLVAWVLAAWVGGLSCSFLRVGYVWTGVQSAPQGREEGRSAKLEEGTTGRMRTGTSRPVGGSTTALEELQQSLEPHIKGPILTSKHLITVKYLELHAAGRRLGSYCCYLALRG